MAAICLTRRVFLAGSGATLFGLVLAGPLMAQQIATPVAINVDRANLAIKGYDPVAYFTAGQPTPGKAEFTATHDGATYRFASAENKTLFEASPARYLPQYGGFCAQAIVAGQKVEVDPTAWKIVDGKLYLNFSHSVNRSWLKDAPKNIQIGDTQWQKIKDIPAKSL